MGPSILRNVCFALLVPLIGSPLAARTRLQTCGTYRGQAAEELDLHQKSRVAGKFKAATGRPAARLEGNILILDDSDGVVARRNPFNLTARSVRFSPTPTGYRFATASNPVDATTPGTPLAGLEDDDTRELSLPFPFRFYGRTHTKIFVNSDGNLTFDAGDADISSRSLGRLNSGPPRIAALFTDLDPTATGGTVFVRSEPTQFTVTWLRVREYSDFGFGAPQTFQITLTPDGLITFAWSQISVTESVVGLSPGGQISPAALVSFSTGSDRDFPATFGERFGDSTSVDLVTASQKVYESQEDAYDYLAFFNTAGISPGPGVVAFQLTVRGRRKGIGDTLGDSGLQYGSPNRLQAVLNLGPVSQYPDDPNSFMPARFGSGDTGLTVVAHEAGHLFLALASVLEGEDRPMLGRAASHWAFTFNSEASLLEGNRLEDLGESAFPRFRSVATVEGFSPLDQYLMGLRAPAEVPATFYVQNATTGASAAPRPGATFHGTRRNVTIDELIATEGRRIPDHTVEQRRYRIGFVLIAPAGTPPSPADLAKVERYRAEFEAAWARYAGGRGTMEATFRRNLSLSVEPAAGLLLGRTVTGTVALDRPAAAPLTVTLRPDSGRLSAPPTVTIPAGQSRATFSLTALNPGVELLRAELSPLHRTAEARVQILPANADGLTITLAAPPNPAPIFRVQDQNELPYPGLRLTDGSTTIPTDADGRAAFPPGVTRVTLEGTSLTGLVPRPPALTPAGIVNAASFRPGLVPGGIATVFGSALAQPTLTIAGRTPPIFFANDTQINFIVPTAVPTGPSELKISTLGGSITQSVPVLPVQPGIFFDAATGRAAAIPRGDSTYEVYGTGFSRAPVSARSGDRPLEVLFSGPAPGFFGLQQINLRPLAPGDPLIITAGNVDSNSVALP